MNIEVPISTDNIVSARREGKNVILCMRKELWRGGDLVKFTFEYETEEEAKKILGEI